ncbi:MAG: tail fiber domain-containing protein [Ferruginibacter sp.]
MKILLIIMSLVTIIFSYNSHAQNVGIGTNTPKARLHVTDSSVLFSATGDIGITGLPPLQGAGRRMFWNPYKAAFRAGYVDGTQWDNGNTGNYSIAMGNSTTAFGFSSVALGFNCSAIGGYSTTLGNNTKANGGYATALGYYTSASGSFSTAMGSNTITSGDYSTAIGLSAIASGLASTAMGENTRAKGYASTVIGMFNDSLLATGETVPANTSPLFIVGNGVDNTTRSNAMVILKNGNTGMGTNAPVGRLHVADSGVVFTGPAVASGATTFAPAVQGAGTRLLWYPGKAAFRAGGVDGTQWDKGNIGTYSFASGLGTIASQGYSTALGFYTTASGATSVALGNQTTAKAFGSLSIGSLNDATDNPDPLNINSTDRIFQVGNGYGFFPGNAMTVLRSGNVGIGTINPTSLLHIKGNEKVEGELQVTDSSVVFSATSYVTGNGNPPVEWQGRRMMWYADKAAFRVGAVDGAQWNKDSIGIYSFSTGFKTMSKGGASFSSGQGTTAATGFSTAMGWNTTATGTASTVLGWNSLAAGHSSIAAGAFCQALGDYSTAMGSNGIASGGASTALGNYPTATSIGSVAIGTLVIANSYKSTSLGVQNDPIVTSPTNNWIPTEPLLIVGNGVGGSVQSNAMVILKNGNTGIGNNAPNAPLAFANATGRKISLYDGGLNNYYGLGVEPSQLQIYTDGSGAKISFGYYNGGIFTERMYLSNSTGILTVNGTNYPSDARYKKQITRLQKPLEKIMAINGVEYLMRTDEFPSKHFDTKLQVGLIAQDVEKVLPQAVQTDNQGYKSVDYAKVVPLLVEGIKQQQKQIDELKALVQKLINK